MLTVTALGSLLMPNRSSGIFQRITVRCLKWILMAHIYLTTIINSVNCESCYPIQNLSALVAIETQTKTEVSGNTIKLK